MGNKMELGSEFNLDVKTLSIKENNIFNYLANFDNIEYFDSGRSALKHIAFTLEKFFPKQDVLLPEFICKSVVDSFRGMNIIFYKLLNDFIINIDDLQEKIREKQVIFIMHYFGAIQPQKVLEKIKEISEQKHCIIIEDTTHSIFSTKSTVGDYQICSIRKWLPIPQGGILYSKQDRYNILRKINYNHSNDNDKVYAMILKELFLNHDVNCNELYRKIFSTCEELLDEQKEIKLCSDISKFLASCFDIKDLVVARKNNYKNLKQNFSPALDISDCPFVFPVYVPERDKLRKYLIEHKIYCAVHWPFDGFQENTRCFAKNCSDNLLSLPIDQRYNQEHMDYMISVLQSYGGALSF